MFIFHGVLQSSLVLDAPGVNPFARGGLHIPVLMYKGEIMICTQCKIVGMLKKWRDLGNYYLRKMGLDVGQPWNIMHVKECLGLTPGDEP